ncbi:MAG: MMPL family transporter, partial [Actinomycetota bacterium]
MFDRLGRFVVRRRWFVVVAVVVLLGSAGAIGGGVADRLTSSGFENEDSESFRGAEILEDDFGVRDPNLILLVESDSGSVDDAEAARAGRALTEELGSEEGVADVVSYWTDLAPALRSEDGSEGLVVATITGSEDVADERAGELTEEYTRPEGPVAVSVGGTGPVFHEVSTQVEEDLVRAESIAIPITLILLVFVFGSVIAATLPLAIGVFAIIGSFFALYVITEFADVSIFALNLITMLGLGLGIDYSLFIVSRYREELGRGLAPHDAVVATVGTAGRTIAFSGITVALSLAALVLFPLDFLRSFAYAGIAVVLLAAIAATVFLPALLAVLGNRVERFSIRRRRESKSEHDGFWHRMATFVMRRPIPIATSVVVVLLLLGAPFLGVEWGQTDYRVLPEEADVRQVSEHIARDFPINKSETMSITVPESTDSNEIASYSGSVSEVDGVANVQSEAGTFAEGRRVAAPDRASARFAGQEGTWLSVSLVGGDETVDGRAVVSDIRAVDAPFEALVSGRSASQ